MTLICLIFSFSVVALWFYFNEYPILFGLYLPASTVKRTTFNVLVAVALSVAVFLSGFAGVERAVLSQFDFGVIDPKSIIMMILSSLIVLLLIGMFSIKGSVLYAVSGGLLAYGFLHGYEPGIMMVISWLAASLIAFLLAALVSWILKKTIARRNIHLIVLSYYLRFAIIGMIILTAMAVGINFGGFLMAVTDFTGSGIEFSWLIALMLALLMAVLMPFIYSVSSDRSEKFEDFTVYSVLTIGISVTLTLLIFSFDSISSLFGLKPAPLSVSSLLISSVLGASMIQKNVLIESDEYIRELIALIVAPVGSLLVSYILLSISGNSEESLVDYTVISLAIIVLLALVFAGYHRNQRRQREATERLVYSQQQQIYENSRALNDMELKVVISENQALHNAVQMKRQEVMNVALSIVEQREYLESLSSIASRIYKSGNDEERSKLIAELNASLKQRLSYDRDVDSQYFYAQAESLHEDFNAKLSENFPGLTQQEKRLATLLRLGFSSKYIATLMNITPKSVEISRYRLRQKLGLEKGDNLVNFIKSI